MLMKRIIPCLDVKDNRVVKGIKFRDHAIVGDILPLAQHYSKAGADELVFYDITASSDARTIEPAWVNEVARYIDIPFCVAGGIRSVRDAAMILHAGADKISINSPALERPELIDELVSEFGQQCVVVGIDSMADAQHYVVYQYTGDVTKTKHTTRLTDAWLREVQDRGAGEIVLNCMNQDGARQGYDLLQLQRMRAIAEVPLIASGGAGTMQHFSDVFIHTAVDGALAASVFHQGLMSINELKDYLVSHAIEVRIC